MILLCLTVQQKHKSSRFLIIYLTCVFVDLISTMGYILSELDLFGKIAYSYSSERTNVR